MTSQESNIPPTAKLKPEAIYIQDCISNQSSKLHALDLVTGKVTFISRMAAEVTDIAFVGSQLYGLNQTDPGTQLITINPNTGAVTIIGNIGFAVVGLAYNRQRQTLYATTAKQLIAIDLKTGKGTPSVTVASQDHNCGEVAFDADGTAYITLIGYDRNKLLASCNLDTSEVKIIGDTGFPNLASMEFVGDVLYGVTGNFFNLGQDGQLIRINTNTGKGTLVTLTAPIGRWAGISISEPATEVTTDTTLEVISGKESEVTKADEEKSMSLLTIDTKNNCYVIDPSQMNHLQQNVAKSFTLERGTYDIKITSGRYSYAKAKTEGEPLVLLWIYGVDGGRFVNKNTGFEIGATWTSLHGYDDRLTLEVRERAVLCALFLDVNMNDNSGSVQLLINSDKPYFNPQTWTVDSKENCYILDENYLSSLKHWGGNTTELNPGNYRIKIREGTASYWSDNKKFELEPWTLIWIQGGNFVTKLTDVEVEETWCSLNGLKDEFVLEVKEKTTLTGLFFDTYNHDNEGQLVLAIEPISDTDLMQRKQQRERRKVSSFIQNQQPVGAASTKNSSTRVEMESEQLTQQHRYGTPIPADIMALSFDSFERNPATDIVCVTPIRTIIRREEEILLVRKVRKVEEIEVSPACPVNTNQVTTEVKSLEVRADAWCQDNEVRDKMEDFKNRIRQDKNNLNEILRKEFIYTLWKNGKIPNVSNTLDKTVTAIIKAEGQWNYGTTYHKGEEAKDPEIDLKVDGDGNQDMKGIELDERDMLFYGVKGTDGKTVNPAALVTFKIQDNNQSGEFDPHKFEIQYLDGGKNQDFALEPGETVYFINNDEPGFYDDNKDALTVKCSIV
jgi:DNA-binding beta-propeller fold protein YncE